MKKSTHQFSKPDEELLQRIFDLLKGRLKSNPYGWDGEFAKEICSLPKGLRAMAATHHLDVSLVLDDIGWHFLNFGEAGHVKETEVGLRELGMDKMVNLFTEAYRIMKPHLPELHMPSGDYYACLERSDEMKRINELSNRARIIQKEGGIYSAWVKYARKTPESVFGA